SDLARTGIDGPDECVSSLALEPLVVPESRMVIDLLGDMQKEDVRFAVVVDEFGGTAGIVTIEDVVERLVGPISSSGSHRNSAMEYVDAGTWITAGTTDTGDLERTLGVSLPVGDWNTVAGLVIGLAGHIPGEGESVEIDGFRLTVIEVLARRVLRVEIARI
ncbi:MAG: transporter associated domain-containing protein, partial [Acidimicrobiia bacterium]